DDVREDGKVVFAAEVLENLLERRNDPSQKNPEHAKKDDEHGARVHHRAAHLALQFGGLFIVDRKAVQDCVEDAADLARLDEVHVKRVENLGVPAQRITERGALLDTRLHVAEHHSKGRVVRLPLKNLEALNDR